MPSDPADHEVTLVAFDGSPTSVAAAEWAGARISRLPVGHSTLAMVLVESPRALRHDASGDVRRDDLLATAEDLRARLPHTPVLTRVVAGEVAAVLAGLSGAADLVVVGSGLQPQLLRRTLAERLWAAGVSCVVVVPPLLVEGPVLVPIVTPSVTDETLDWAVREALHRGVVLELVAVVDEDVHSPADAKRLEAHLDEATARVREIAGSQRVERLFLRGDPLETFRRRSAEAGLVILEFDPAHPHEHDRLRWALLLAVLAPTAVRSLPRPER